MTVRSTALCGVGGVLGAVLVFLLGGGVLSLVAEGATQSGMVTSGVYFADAPGFFLLNAAVFIALGCVHGVLLALRYVQGRLTSTETYVCALGALMGLAAGIIPGTFLVCAVDSAAVPLVAVPFCSGLGMWFGKAAALKLARRLGSK